MRHFHRFTNRFVVMLAVLLLLIGSAVMLASPVAAQDEQPTAVFPAATAVNPDAVVIVEPVATDEAPADSPVDSPADPPVVVVEHGISEGILINAIQWLSVIIVVIVVVTGAVLGKSVHELARSQPVQWGITAAANLATLTASPDDDEQIRKLAEQLGYDVVTEGNFKVLKPKSTDGSPPAAAPA